MLWSTYYHVPINAMYGKGSLSVMICICACFVLIFYYKHNKVEKKQLMTMTSFKDFTEPVSVCMSATFHDSIPG